VKPIDDATRRLGRDLLAVQFFGNLVMALLAGVYIALVVDVPRQHRDTFLSLVLAAALLLSLLALWVADRWLKPVRELLAGRADASDAAGVAAVTALWRHPGRVVVLLAAAWSIGVATVPMVFRALVGMEWLGVVRVAAVGLVFGAMTVVAVGLLLVRSTQRLVTALFDRLPARELVRSLPEAGLAWGLPVRVISVVATTVMVALPMVLLVLISTVLHEELADAALQRRAADATTVLYSVGALGVVMVRGAVVVAWALGAALSEPLRGVGEDARRVAAGQLTRPTVVPGLGETWKVSRVFARLSENLLDVMSQVHKAEHRLSGTVRTLTESGRRFQGGAEEQAAALNQTSATTEELAQSARQIATNAQSVLEIAQKTLEAADAGQGSAEAFQSAVERMRQDNQSIAAAVERLRKRVQQIGRIIEFINTVADRSDLLALSAELEGTRAGDVGRGFSLVASEMRRLAENVLESTAEVEELITEIREATRQTAAATEKGSELASSSTGLAQQVFRSLTDVAELAGQTSNAVRTISLATQQQQTGTDQLAEAMSDILAVTQQSLAATRQLSGATDRLETLSSSLRSLVDRFKVAE